MEAQTKKSCEIESLYILKKSAYTRKIAVRKLSSLYLSSMPAYVTSEPAIMVASEAKASEASSDQDLKAGQANAELEGNEKSSCFRVRRFDFC